MIKLYHAPLARSVRILWLLEELGLEYELVTLELAPPAPKPFNQATPSGKVPTIEDGDITMFESRHLRLGPANFTESRFP